MFNKLVLILTFALCTVSAEGQDCFIYGGGEYKISEVISCLRSIKLSDEERQVTLDQVKLYLDGYAFRDLSLNLPDYGYAGKSVHISKRLEEIGAMVYESTFDFYGNISKLIKSLHCSHTLFEQPCMMPFNWELPIYFEIQYDPYGGQHVVIGRSFYWNYDQYVDPRIEGAQILYVDPNGKKILNDNEQISPDALKIEEAIAQWADEEEHVSRNPYARFEWANIYSYYLRDARYYSIPKSDYMTILFQTTSGKLVESKVQYVAYAYKTFDILERACPIDEYYNPGPDPEQIPISEWPKDCPNPDYPDQLLDQAGSVKRKPVFKCQSDTNTTLPKPASKQAKNQPSRIERIINKISNLRKNAPIDKKLQAQNLKRTLQTIERKTTLKLRDKQNPLWRERQKSVIEMGKKAQIKSTWAGTGKQVNLDEGIDPITAKKVEVMKSRIEYIQKKHGSDIQKKNERNEAQQNSHKSFDVAYVSQDGSLAAYYISPLEIGIIRILSFQPYDENEFQFSFLTIVRLFSDENSRYKTNKIYIDLRYNGGGYATLPPIVLRFLFPQADSPIWPPVDQVKAPINSVFGLIRDFITKYDEEDTDLRLDLETGELIQDYYSQEGQQRTTSYNNDNFHDEVTVDLTKRALFYAGHIDQLRKYAQDWKLSRQTVWQPKDVTVIVDGLCIGACSLFAKEIHQKKVARIIGVGNFRGVLKNQRFDIGTAGGSSPRYSQEFIDLLQDMDENPDKYAGIDFDPESFPKPFYRYETKLQYAENEFYGVTENTKDKLSDFQIYDADFLFDYVDNIYDMQYEDEYMDDNFYWLLEQFISQKFDTEISGAQTKQNDEPEEGCLYGEHELNGTKVPDLCIDAAREDPDAYYGFKCSADKDRNEVDGQKIIGSFIRSTDGCEFAYCRAGFSRIDGICVADTLLKGEDENEVFDPRAKSAYDQNVGTKPEVKEPEIVDEVVPEKKKKKVDAWLVVSIVVIVIIAVFIVILIIVICCTVSKVRSLNKKNEQEQNRHVTELQDSQIQIIREQRRSRARTRPTTESLDKSKSSRRHQRK